MTTSTLSSLLRKIRLSTVSNISDILRNYNGNDWYHHIRYRPNNVCTFPILSDRHHDLCLVGLYGHVTLKNVKLIHLLEGSFVLDQRRYVSLDNPTHSFMPFQDCKLISKEETAILILCKNNNNQ
uniref:Uncharacterized protein n=1 Tax=viral metagenome TaxID=1070528 RepID=A0A6C0KHV9_9ZZZZ